MVGHGSVGMILSDTVQRVAGKHLRSLLQKFKIHHIVDDNPEALVGIVPASDSFHHRRITRCKKSSGLFDLRLVGLVSGQTEGIAVAAPHLKPEVMVI